MDSVEKSSTRTHHDVAPPSRVQVSEEGKRSTQDLQATLMKLVNLLCKSENIARTHSSHPSTDCWRNQTT